MQPETRYAETAYGWVAYKQFGQGPLDLIFVTDWVQNVEVMWEEPRIERFLSRLASFSRVVVFDKRGTGASDPLPSGRTPTLEEWVDDIRAVMTSCGIERAAVVGQGAGGPIAILFAATHPQRATALAVAGGAACFRRHPDYPAGIPPKAADALLEPDWGPDTPNLLRVYAPSLADDKAFSQRFAHFLRLSLTPAAAARLASWVIELDVRSVVPTIQVPTLVVHRQGDMFMRIGHAQWIAEHLPGSRLVILPGNDHAYYAGDQDGLLAEIQEFLTGVRGGADYDRVLATVLLTDIVDSTRRAAALGDHRWRDLLDEHDGVARKHIDYFRGRYIRTLGDGLMATFDGPARAIRCAQAITRDVRDLGLELRAGLHTGEVEMRGDDLVGIAVHIGARVAALAEAGEILVSESVPPLVVGSEISFRDRGKHALKGVPGEWGVFAVAPESG